MGDCCCSTSSIRVSHPPKNSSLTSTTTYSYVRTPGCWMLFAWNTSTPCPKLLLTSHRVKKRSRPQLLFIIVVLEHVGRRLTPERRTPLCRGRPSKLPFVHRSTAVQRGRLLPCIRESRGVYVCRGERKARGRIEKDFNGDILVVSPGGRTPAEPFFWFGRKTSHTPALGESLSPQPAPWCS